MPWICSRWTVSVRGWRKSSNPGTARFSGEMQYSLGENETTVPEDSWDKDIPAATNAGIYYVWYRVVGDENHLDSEPACIQVIIREREDSGETDPEDNASDETDPDGTDPESKDPDETKPNATDPEDKVPEKTDPDETDPESNNLDETKPDETDPEYKDPESNPQEDTAPKEEDKIELFVTRCYQVILGRNPDEIGLNDWSNRLSTGQATAAEIVNGFVTSGQRLCHQR